MLSSRLPMLLYMPCFLSRTVCMPKSMPHGTQFAGAEKAVYARLLVALSSCCKASVVVPVVHAISSSGRPMQQSLPLLHLAGCSPLSWSDWLRTLSLLSLSSSLSSSLSRVRCFLVGCFGSFRFSDSSRTFLSAERGTDLLLVLGPHGSVPASLSIPPVQLEEIEAGSRTRERWTDVLLKLVLAHAREPNTLADVTLEERYNLWVWWTRDPPDNLL